MQRTRAELKVFFKKNAIPTQSNFEDLIESALNQKDDGVVKLPDDPLTLQGAGAEEALLRFSRVDAAGGKPTWLINQKPDGAPGTGLAFQDAGGSVRLFLQSGTGNVGIGTSSPTGTLEVKGTVVISAGTGWATQNGKMSPGSLTIGDIDRDYGGATDGSWSTANTAALLLEAKSNTEIAVHDAHTRVTSLMYYEGESKNRITIGRDMGWGPLSELVVKGVLKADALELQQPEAWQTPDLLNSWQKYNDAYNPPAYYKDGLGVVHLRGLVRRFFTTPEPQPPRPPNAANIADQIRFANEMAAYAATHAAWVTQRDQFVALNGVSIFQLPPGHRPAFRELRAVMTNPNVAGRLDIDAQGNVVAMAGNSGWFSLDGISFRAASA